MRMLHGGMCMSLFIVAGMLVLSVDGRERQGAVEVASGLNLADFAGTWYEIARIPNRHEEDLVECTSTFKFTNDNKIVIVNRGYKGSRGGQCKTIKGEVSIPDRNNPAAMKVKVWFFSIDYRVIDFDKVNYRYALVTTGSKDHLWVLSKTPIMEENIFSMLVDSAKQKGYDPNRLERVSQEHNSAVVNNR